MAAALKDRIARQASGDTDLGFDPLGTGESRLISIPLNLIDPDPNQPRKTLGDLGELASSIKEHGLINPIIVEVAGGGRYLIMAGERRFAACRDLGLKTVQCIVRTVAEQSRLILQLIENLQRKDLHPLDEARAFKRLMDEFNLTQRELASRLGKSIAATNQTLRILDLDPKILADVQTCEHANKSLLLEIAKEPEPARQAQLWEEAKDGSRSVRQTRAKRPGVSSSPPRKSSCTIDLPDARVIVRFLTGLATPDRVQAALKAASERHHGEEA